MIPWAMPLTPQPFKGATLIATQQFSSSSSTPASLGAQIGDLALLFGAFGGPTSGSGQTWTRQSLNNTQCSLYWKLLAAGDMSQPLGLSGYAGVLVIYRGAISLTQQSTVTGNNSTITAPGFAPTSNHQGLIAVALAITAGSAPTLSSPATWAPRGSSSWSSPGDGPGANYAVVQDRLSPPNGKYDGSGLSAVAGNSQTTLFIFEMRSA